MSVGQLTRVPLREVWRHEAHDFTTWMVDAIDEIGEAVGLRIEEAEREHSTGNFSVDIVAKLQDGSPIIIENQLEKSDHDHLGKLITYLAAVDARAAIWVVAEPRQEHIAAVVWLNESGLADFYLVKVEAVRIGESQPAPLFTKIVGPSEETTVAGATKKELNASDKSRIRFWEGLLSAGKDIQHPHSNISASRATWISCGAGKTGVTYIHSIKKDCTRIEVYIDTGDGDINNRYFDQLYSHKETIESDFGHELNWLRLDGKRACRFEYTINDGGLFDEDRWGEIHQTMINLMIKLENSLKSRIRALS